MRKQIFIGLVLCGEQGEIDSLIEKLRTEKNIHIMIIGQRSSQECSETRLRLITRDPNLEERIGREIIENSQRLTGFGICSDMKPCVLH